MCFGDTYSAIELIPCVIGGRGGIRTHSPEGTDLQSAVALQLYRPPKKISYVLSLLHQDYPSLGIEPKPYDIN